MKKGVTYITCAKCSYKFVFIENNHDFKCPQCGFLNTVEGSQEPPSDILKEAFKIINGERKDAYGDPEMSFGIIGDYWNLYLRHRFQTIKVNLKPTDVAHLMTLFKMARMLGQKPCRDNYRDAVGYMAIAADRLSGEKEQS